MRYRVDTIGGYASFDEKDEAKALELYKDQGYRLRICRYLGDEGEVIAGLPLGVDYRTKGQEAN